MRLQAIIGLAACAVALATTARAAAVLRLDHVAARVVVIPEARGDIAVSVRPGRGAAPRVETRRQADGLHVVGLQSQTLLERFAPWAAGSACRKAPGGVTVEAGGRMWPRDDLALVTARVPLDARLVASGAVFGRTAPADSLDLRSDSCGLWLVGPVRGNLVVSQTGPGVVRIARAGGGLQVTVAGRGGVVIADGVNGQASLSVDGPGWIVHQGSVGTLKAATKGRGSVKVATVTGTVETSEMGLGGVTWGRPKGQRFCTRC